MKKTENQEKEESDKPSLSKDFNGKEDPILTVSFWIRLGVGVFLTLTIFLIVFFLVSESEILNTINASFANLALMLTFAFFSYFFDKGYFDGIAYGFTYMSSFITRAFRGNYGDYVEKQRKKREMAENTRLPFLPYLLVALLWFLILLPTYIVFKM